MNSPARDITADWDAVSPLPAGHGLPWLEKQRREALHACSVLSVPDRKREEWRYTQVDSLLGHGFAPRETMAEGLQHLDIDALRLPGLHAHSLVFANGRFVPSLSQLESLPQGVIVSGLRDALECHPDRVADRLGTLAKPDRHPFAAMNSAEMNDGLFLYMPAGVTLQQPVEVLHISMGLDEAVAIQPRNLVILGHGARATLIERYVGSGKSVYFNNGISEICLDQAAELTHLRLQQESDKAYHLHSDYIEQGGASSYQSTRYSLGGIWSRNEINVSFTAEEASAELYGLMAIGDRQLNDIHLNVDHGVPGCESKSEFRSLLYGKGRGVFDGRIHVAPDAQKTIAHLNNANLMLTRDAEMDTKPQLEIYADDVKCSHGTTIGELEDTQLFYLRSRGIEADMAQRLLCLGFTAEILERCAFEPLREQIEHAISQMLGASSASSASGKAQEG